MIMRVTEYGEEILRAKGRKIDVFDQNLRNLANDMLETMYEAEGIGLAAQQVDLPLMLCVIDVSDLEPELLHYQLDGKRPPVDLFMPLALVNPEVRVLADQTARAEEGCLSFPGIRGEVTRPDVIQVSYQDLDGAAHQLIAEGWLARVVQHEVDHLNGVLFIDAMEPRQLRLLDPKLKRLKRATRDRLKSIRK